MGSFACFGTWVYMDVPAMIRSRNYRLVDLDCELLVPFPQKNNTRLWIGRVPWEPPLRAWHVRFIIHAYTLFECRGTPTH